jgi:hypothetical protein
MRAEPNIQLYVLILVVVLLILLLWFLSRDPWKQFAARITAGLARSGAQLKSIDWSPISPPDANGIRATNGLYNLPSNGGIIEITTYGKDEKAISEFIGEVKFYFEPIFEKVPASRVSRLRDLVAPPNRRLNKYQEGTSKNRRMQESQSTHELQFEKYEDLAVQLDLRPGGISQANGKQAQAIAFMIDPPINAGRSVVYYATVTAVYDVVAASDGGVSATLRQDRNWIDGGSIGTGGSSVMSSPTYTTAQSFNLTVTGTGGSNYYTLNGTWNVS